MRCLMPHYRTQVNFNKPENGGDVCDNYDKIWD